MSFRSLASLRVAASFAVVLIVSACSDDRVPQLSAVETIELPAADAGQQANQNIANPTLQIPVTYPVGEGDELALVWSEEFSGPEIDPATWFFATGDGTEVGLPGGWGNDELQYYLPDNAMIVNGVLEITARRESVGGLNYTSARINTQDRFAFKYGRIEASMKLPGGQGLWPAFWMLSQDSDYLCSGEPCIWAATGEIDIVEAINLDGTGGNELFSTIAFGDEFPGNLSTETLYTPGVDVTESFNTYALEWDEDEIRWYFNGELYAMQPASAWFSTADNAGPNAPFDQNFHILLNLAVGGNFPQSPDGTTPWPVTMEVDWVRVYSGEPPPADAGDVPENAVFVTDPNVTADLAAPMLDNFGSGATFNAFYAGDPDFKPTLQVTSGNAFGGEDVGFVAFTGYDAGFAADYQTFSFKVKGLPGDELEIKFFGSPENSIIINLGTYAGAVDLGNGWFQVTIPMSDFAANAFAFTGFLIGPPGDQGAPFTFLLTDIGFNGSIVTTPADAGTTPEVTLYARGGATDLVFGEDYTEVAVFGSGAIANNNNTGDVDFSPAFSVSTGFGYDKWNAQLAFLGFDAGFASSYVTLDFKVKGMAGDVIRVKLLNDPNPDYVDVDLTSSDYATALGNGWYQVAVPIADIPGDVATASGLLFETIEPAPDEAFTFLLNDIGFSGTTFIPADPGIIPEAVVYASDPAVVEDLGTYTPNETFGSGAVFDYAFSDPDFDPVLQVTSGTGYGGQNGFAVFAFYPAGFAAGYETLHFKVKGDASNLEDFEAKFFGPDSSVVYDLTTYAGSVLLGNGWYQVSIPLSDFGATIDTAEGFLLGPFGDQVDPFTFLLTDIGFSSAAADPGIIPEAVVYASDPAVVEDLGTYTPNETFGSGAVFDYAFSDPDFDPVLQVTSGTGYGGQNGFAVFAFYPAGFAAGYETLHFKVKGDASNLEDFEAKFFGPDSSVVYDLTTYAGSVLLGNGWYQVSIPLSDFGATIDTAEGFLLGPFGDQVDPFTFLLTDIGFSSAAADPSIIPEAVVYASDPAVVEDLGTYTPNETFGSGAVFDYAFSDPDFDPVLQVTSGTGYGGQNGFAVFAFYPAGFAAGYETLHFKVKGDASNLEDFEAKFFGPDSSVVYDLTTYAGSVSLGNGWYQVSIPLSDFGATIDTAEGFLLGPFGDQVDPFTFLLTDIGFSGTAGGGGGGPVGNIVPDGDFENGVLVDPPWKTFANNGLVEVSSAQANGGTFSARLLASGAGSFPTLKVERLEEGNLSGGESVTVSFDAIAVDQQPGAVVFFAELLTERAGDNGATNEFLIAPPVFLTGSWTTYSFDTNLGADAGGGVSLQFKADCGGDAACVLDAHIDNVSIVIN